MKTRVIEIDNLFYPQYRFWFIWLRFSKYIWGGPECVSFATIEQAIEFCIREKSKRVKYKTEEHKLAWRDH
jgi:hypothetical protein